MQSMKLLLVTIAILMGWWIFDQVWKDLKGTRHVPFKERLKDLGSRVHSIVGTVAVVIVVILLVRLIVQVGKSR